MLIYLYTVFEKTAQRYFAGWPAGSSWGHLKDRWKSPGFRGRLDGSEGEWSGLRNATLVIVSMHQQTPQEAKARNAI